MSTVPPRPLSLHRAAAELFLGAAPDWYKLTIVAFLILNPVIAFAAGPFVAGWTLLLEFILTLALALKCYPLQPGGLLAIEAVALGLAGPDAVYHEAERNFSVILLLMFMVAGIYFMRELLGRLFARLFVGVPRKDLLALLFCGTAAVLSAFLDALTVMAVVITVAVGLHNVYHRAVSMADCPAELAGAAEEFRAFLRSIVMHAAVGTALGGVCTLVGEPQNLLIGHAVGWSFIDFLRAVAPVSMPVLAAGLAVCLALERLKLFGYGAALPPPIRALLAEHIRVEKAGGGTQQTLRLWFQGAAALALVAGLALHVAEVGLIGLAVIVLTTSLCGVVEEKRLGHAFEDALPFTALLVVFFAIVAVIETQNLFRPIIDFVLAHDGRTQLVLMYAANGLLSAISDNVFVATVYMNAAKDALDGGAVGRAQFELLAVAINTGTNIPSVATPNGQAAFLFLLTSALSPLIRLGYLRMLWMALPYTVVMTAAGLAAVRFLL